MVGKGLTMIVIQSTRRVRSEIKHVGKEGRTGIVGPRLFAIENLTALELD